MSFKKFMSKKPSKGKTANSSKLTNGQIMGATMQEAPIKVNTRPVNG